MQCGWCDTKQSTKYIDHNLPSCATLICHRCNMFCEIFPGLVVSRRGLDKLPRPEGDADKEVIEFQRNFSKPLSAEQFMEWVDMANRPRETIKEIFCYEFLFLHIKYCVGVIQYPLKLRDGLWHPMEMEDLSACALTYPFPSEDSNPEALARVRSQGLVPSSVIHGFIEHAFRDSQDEDSSNSSYVANDVCAQCQRKGQFTKACPRCNEPFYCSHACQKKHWKLHKKECRATKKNGK